MSGRDGGPAFPRIDGLQRVCDGRTDVITTEGATLLDYFAAKAMQAGIGRWCGSGDMYDEAGCTYSRLAQQAYAIADAMLTAREAQP